MSYSHTYYANLGALGDDIEITVEYHKTKGYPGSQEEPEELEGYEVDSIHAVDIGPLMGLYNKAESFADDVNERIAENHEEREE